MITEKQKEYCRKCEHSFFGFYYPDLTAPPMESAECCKLNHYRLTESKFSIPLRCPFKLEMILEEQSAEPTI